MSEQMTEQNMKGNRQKGATPAQLVEFFGRIDPNDANAFTNANNVKIGIHSFVQKCGRYFWYRCNAKFVYVEDCGQFVCTSLTTQTGTANFTITGENSLRIDVRWRLMDGTGSLDKEEVIDFCFSSRHEKLKLAMDTSAGELLTRVNAFIASVPPSEIVPQRVILLKMILEQY
jgi:hypothetical protein